MDAELAQQAGPQLVVPILNARYALNAANARWGSLYDALYGTDALPAEGATSRCLQPARRPGDCYARRVLDQAAPLAVGTHADAVGYRVEGGQPRRRARRTARPTPGRPTAFAGYRGAAASPSSVLFVHHGLHLDLRIDRSTAIGASDPAGVATWCWKLRSPPSSTWRIPSPPWTQRTS